MYIYLKDTNTILSNKGGGKKKDFLEDMLPVGGRGVDPPSAIRIIYKYKNTKECIFVP